MSSRSDCICACQVNSAIYKDVLSNCRKFRGGTCMACRELSELEKEIERVRRALDLLLDRREEMGGTFNKHHDPFSASLPTELVSEIFVHCLPYESSIDVFEELEEKEHIRAVFDLEQTCQRWRNVARSTPRLWTIFSAEIGTSNSEVSVEITQEWLTRSAGLPLFIRLYVKEPTYDVALACAQEVVISALLHAQRWKVSSLEVPSHWMHWISEALSDTNLDGLEHLLFGATDEYTEEDILVLTASPRQFTLYQAWLCQISMNQSRITHFSASNDPVTIEECLQLFRDMPCLSSCRLGAVQRGSTGLTNPSFVVVNYSMRRIVTREGCASTFWDHFSFPALNYLDILVRDDEFWLCLQNFIRRSNCEIKEIFLEDDEKIESPRTRMLETFQLTPSLERLSLMGLQQSASFSLMAAAAVSSNTEPHFMSRLRFLTCSTYLSGFDWSSLVMFLTCMMARKERSLQSFDFLYKVGGEVKLDEDTFRSVMAAMDGLKFTIKSKDNERNQIRDVVEVHRRRYGYEGVKG